MKIPVPALDGNFDATTSNSMNKCDLNKDYCFNVSFELISVKFYQLIPRILNTTLHNPLPLFLSIISLFSSVRTTTYNAFQLHQM